MKRRILLLLSLCAINLKAQITFEHKYDSSSAFLYGSPAVSGQLMIINFEISGERYVNINRWGKYISIYDLNHALVKEISLSGLPLNGNVPGDVLYLSEQLFNTDSQMEFMYAFSGSTDYTGIYNEAGTLLFSDTGVATVHVNYPLQQWPIYNTSQGTKMILSYRGVTALSQSNMVAKVFSLPGTLTTAIQIANQNLAQAQGVISNPVPNPAISSTRIDYALPKEGNHGDVIFYDQAGKEIKRFRVDKTFDHLLVSTADIPAGMYFYQLMVNGSLTSGKKLVVIK